MAALQAHGAESATIAIYAIANLDQFLLHGSSSAPAPPTGDGGQLVGWEAAILSALRAHPRDLEVQAAGLNCLGHLFVRDAGAVSRASACGAVEAVAAALLRFGRTDGQCARSACVVFSDICFGSSEEARSARDRAGSMRCVESIAAVLRAHAAGDPSIVRNALAALGGACSWHSCNSGRAVAAECIETVATALLTHKQDVLVQHNGVNALVKMLQPPQRVTGGTAEGGLLVDRRNAIRIGESGAVEAVCESLRTFQSSAGMAFSCCGLLLLLAGQTPALQQRLHSAGAVKLVEAARARHSTDKDMTSFPEVALQRLRLAPPVLPPVPTGAGTSRGRTSQSAPAAGPSSRGGACGADNAAVNDRRGGDGGASASTEPVEKKAATEPASVSKLHKLCSSCGARAAPGMRLKMCSGCLEV